MIVGSLDPLQMDKSGTKLQIFLCVFFNKGKGKVLLEFILNLSKHEIECIFMNVFSALSCNGTLLFRKVAHKTKYCAHGLSYRFPPIETYEEEKIYQHGVDLIEVSVLIFSIFTFDLLFRWFYKQHTVNVLYLAFAILGKFSAFKRGFNLAFDFNTLFHIFINAHLAMYLIC